MEQAIKQKLKEAKSVDDMLKVLQSSYRLDTCVPGSITRATVIAGLESAINMLKPLKR